MVAPRRQVQRSKRKAPLREGRGWLTAAAVAGATGGEVVRRGRTGHTVFTDTRAPGDGGVFVALKGLNHDAHDHLQAAVDAGAAGLVVDREVPLRLLPDGVFVIRVPDTGAALMALSAEHRSRSTARVVGITGSCGKTSVKEMLGAVLAAGLRTVRSPASFNNNVGVPLTLFQLQADTQAAVVEMGTNAKGEIAELAEVVRPDVGIVTCVSPAHLSGLGSLEGVAVEKRALIEGLPDSGLAILNGDDRSCVAMAERTAAKPCWIRLDREADWFATDVRFSGMGTCFRLRGERCVTLPRLGTHNVYNALFTLAAATHLGVDEDVALEVLAGLPSSDRRLERKRIGDLLVFDDTYNMNPTSARAALQALAGLPGAGRRVVVFGEMLELGDESSRLHRELGAEVRETGQDVLVCVGEGARCIAKGALKAGMPATAIHMVADVPGAMELLLANLRGGDHVLFKGSRRVALDRLVDGLAAHWSRDESVREAAL